MQVKRLLLYDFPANPMGDVLGHDNIACFSQREADPRSEVSTATRWRVVFSLKGCQIVAGGGVKRRPTGVEEPWSAPCRGDKHFLTPVPGVNSFDVVRWSALRSDHRLLSDSPSGYNHSLPRQW